MSSKPILISGIQPTGPLHLGNYLGALKNFVALQNSGKYQCYFFIADYHSLTEDFSAGGGPVSDWNPSIKSAQILDLAASYLSAGLDPKKSVIFQQSVVHHAPELAWILETITPMGELSRMTQFKDKSGDQKENINVGLFAYPVLMAADVLMFDAKFVPVGHDQLQHLELVRTLARKFNSKFGPMFAEPKELLTNLPRVMSLDDPAKKMSKSRPAGCLFLSDSPEEIEKKIRTAVTDSGSGVKFDPQNKAAVSNLMMIYSELSGLTIPEVEAEFSGKGYADFKKRLAEVVIEYCEPFRARKAKLKMTAVKTMLAAGSKKAHEIAKKKMLAVKKKIGLS